MLFGRNKMNYRSEAPLPVRDFLVYHDTIKGQSAATVDSYYLDLRTFTRYLMIERDIVPRDTPLEDIDIRKADLPFYAAVTLSEVYDFLAYLSRDRELNAASRARMIVTIKGFFRYLTDKTHQITENPVRELDSPKPRKALPRYLTLEESQRLLTSVEGKNRTRDYCILCLFLNCGLRVSEMVNLNITDIRQDSLLIHGKGSKERRIFFSKEAVCKFEEYLEDRKIRYNKTKFEPTDPLFVNQSGTKLTSRGIRYIVSRYSSEKEGTGKNISPHAFRHTFATTMLNNGADIRVVQEMLGHSSISTTQHYTHLTRESIQKSYNLAHPHSGEKK